MALNPNIPLSAQGVNPLGAIFDANKLKEAKLVQQAKTQELDTAAREQEKKSLIDTTVRLNEYLKKDDTEGAKRFMESNISAITARNGNAMHSQDILNRLNEGDIQGLQNDVDSILALNQASLQNPAGLQEFLGKAQLAGLQPGTDEFNKAIRIELGLAPRAGTTSANERIANDPTLTSNVADSQKEITSATSEGRVVGAQQGEDINKLAFLDANMPTLEATVAQLNKLNQVATYTASGKLTDASFRQAGLKVPEGATARAQAIALVNSTILPMLRPIFGAAFTEREGDKLIAVWGDPDASPEEKSAALEGMMTSVKLEAATLRRKLGKQPVSEPASTKTQQSDPLGIR